MGLTLFFLALLQLVAGAAALTQENPVAMVGQAGVLQSIPAVVLLEQGFPVKVTQGIKEMEQAAAEQALRVQRQAAEMGFNQALQELRLITLVAAVGGLEELRSLEV
jgi:thioredoxin-like negative regulator of GroEL